MKRIAVLASGGGSNLAALFDYLASLAAPPATVHLVASDRKDAGALRRAGEHGVRAVTIADASDGETLTRLLLEAGTDVVVLAGYLKLVPLQTTVRFGGAMVNVHPALLPLHGGPGMYGRRVHRAVLAAGDRESGATVHFVDARYDHGAPIAWARVPVVAGDTEDSLAARVLGGEHFILPRVVHALAAGQVRLAGSGAVVVAAGAAQLFACPPAGVSVRLAG
jgi:formyltetrahydrofolate-dependent phosphoribosylglycinamide formyltransferase